MAATASGGQAPPSGPHSLIRRRCDPRLIARVAPAVAQAAMESGVATRPIEDFTAYRARLNEFVYQSGLIMKPLFQAAKSGAQRVAYAEGEDERVLRAAQVVGDEGMARPPAIGRPAGIEARRPRPRLGLKRERDFDLVDPNNDPRYQEYSAPYYRLARRKGVTLQIARLEMRRRYTLIGAMLVH